MSDRKTKFTLDESVEVFSPPEALRAGAHVRDLPGYHALYDRSTREADEFWLEAARELFFAESSTRGLEWNFDGVCKGDVVAIYLPMILELPVAMLACARIGAPHSVIFAGFSAESLAQRVQQADARVLITADAFCRGPKLIHLKALADRALAICEQAGHSVRTQIVVEHAARSACPPASRRPPSSGTRSM
ncbi:hypothetical protein M3Y99_01790900 [Aphelenchoides fujianensis]|nr:hypothetical protein M3Y99_01790900 [Aphelenchoides fujianensis]